MEFVVIGRDGIDSEALNRRMAAREKHIALSNEAIKRGEQVYGGAILDESGAMRGSVMIVNFISRAELDKWLEREPYVTGNVWQSIEVLPYRTGPSFQHLTKQSDHGG